MIEIKTASVRGIIWKEHEVHTWVVGTICYVVEGTDDLSTYICPNSLNFPTQMTVLHCM